MFYTVCFRARVLSVRLSSKAVIDRHDRWNAGYGELNAVDAPIT